MGSHLVRLVPLLVGAGLLAAGGCGLVEKLRQEVHGDEVDVPELGNAGLRVEVEPPTGLSILLDGLRVASTAPYVNRRLRAGPHRLEVRAMGYHPFTLPVVLTDGELLTVPVALRPRAGAAPETPELSPSAPGPEPPEAPAPPLPAGVKPIALTLAPKPDVPILLDGVVQGREVLLERVYGRLQVGLISLRYTIGGAGLLTFELPADDATWYKQSTRLPAGATVKLPRGPLRLRRVAADGTDQVVLLRR